MLVAVLGGYGFTRDFPLEQIYRDNRLNMIHEGTAGIQSLDLLGRKTTMARGEAFKLFISRVDEACTRTSEDVDIAPYANVLRETLGHLSSTTRYLTTRMMEGDAEAAMSNSHEYLNAVGHVTIAWMWLEQAHAAKGQLSSGSDPDFLRGKVSAMKYFFDHELVKVPAQCKILQHSTVVHDLDVAQLLS